MEKLPIWIIRNLRKYHNCLLDNETQRKLGEDVIISELNEMGFEGVCIVPTNGDFVIEVKTTDGKFD
ncbi:hypothetical protein [Anaerorhabdus sp.]|uniref:hypothetical protein n=1 Tax=Anaerorhabdus sp. TaxID=1872524 RepID=UPI002FC9C10F